MVQQMRAVIQVCHLVHNTTRVHVYNDHMICVRCTKVVVIDQNNRTIRPLQDLSVKSFQPDLDRQGVRSRCVIDFNIEGLSYVE